MSGIRSIFKSSYLLHSIKHPDAAIAFLTRAGKICKLTGSTREQVKSFFWDLASTAIYDQLTKVVLAQEKHMQGDSTLTPLKAPLIYVICRILSPRIVIETGVSSGVSSAFILRALQDNGLGHLYSIDVPSSTLTQAGKEVGWIVPSGLRDGWTLIAGRGTEILPTLLEKFAQIDVFLHDSDHSYQNMTAEFRLVWPHLRVGGVLLSDDVNWNRAFKDFAKEVQQEPVIISGFGGIRKRSNLRHPTH